VFHDGSMTAFAEVCAAACLGHARYPFSACLVSYELYAAIYLHAHACAAAALQFLCSHAPQPAHGSFHATRLSL
jgi:hypothetical protein